MSEVETTAPETLELSPLDSAVLTRYYAQRCAAHALLQMIEGGITDAEAEISLCQQRLAFLQERLIRLRDDQLVASSQAQEAEHTLRTVEAQQAAKEGVDPEMYKLDVTPNGTVTSMSRKT